MAREALEGLPAPRFVGSLGGVPVPGTPRWVCRPSGRQTLATLEDGPLPGPCKVHGERGCRRALKGPLAPRLRLTVASWAAAGGPIGPPLAPSFRDARSPPHRGPGRPWRGDPAPRLVGSLVRVGLGPTRRVFRPSGRNTLAALVDRTAAACRRSPQAATSGWPALVLRGVRRPAPAGARPVLWLLLEQ